MVSHVPGCAARAWIWLFLSMLAAPGVSLAQDVFEVAPSCGSADELDQEWPKLVGPRSQITRPRVALTTAADAFRLEVETPSGPRVLSDNDCRALFRSAVLIVALAMADPAPQPEPPKELPAREHESRAPASTSGSLALRAGAAFGLVPAMAASLGLDLGLRRRAWGLMLTSRYLTPREHLNRLAQGVRVEAFAASVMLTWDPLPVLGLGLGLEGYALRGRGSAGLTVQHHDVAWLWGPRLQALWRVVQGRHLDLELGLAGTYLPDNARFQLDDGGLVYATSHLAVEGSLGLRWRFL